MSTAGCVALAKSHKAHKTVVSATPARSSSRSTSRLSAKSAGTKSVSSRSSSRHSTFASSRHHGRYRTAAGRRATPVAHASKTRYAYPISIFMMHPPEFERDQLPGEVSSKIARSFEEGRADEFAARSLVRAGVVSYHPLHGGIFWRREPVKYIIVHSTETGIPMGAARVIDSWGSSGIRHAGAQYVVDRDGTIFQSVDPDLATVHVNVFKTLPGINNDNSIGIEMCHTGHQTYPQEQRQSVIHLVSYLQDRYKVPDVNVVTHRYAQRGDHTDPVNFDWEQFLADKDRFHYQALAYKVDRIQQESANLHVPSVQTAGTISSPAAVTNYAVQMANPRVAPARPSLTVIRQVPRATVQSGGAELRGPIEVEPGFVGKLNQSSEDNLAPSDSQPQIPSAVPLPEPMNNNEILPKIEPDSQHGSAPDNNPSKSLNKDSDVQMFLQPGR